jgi:hypothetical protein
MPPHPGKWGGVPPSGDQETDIGILKIKNKNYSRNKKIKNKK